LTPDLSAAFILRRNPYRDTSFLLDMFTRDAGKITCVAKFSKGKGTRTKGMLEPFRLLEVSWTGRGEVFTLFHADETCRYALKQGALIEPATHVHGRPRTAYLVAVWQWGNGGLCSEQW
jgi:DNA repair protein RecO (recombination protein O)